MLSKPGLGRSQFQLPGTENYTVDCELSEMPIEWLDMAIHGLESHLPFCITGKFKYLPANDYQVLCVVTENYCHILFDDYKSTSSDFAHEIVPVTMLDFCKFLYTDINNEISAWACLGYPGFGYYFEERKEREQIIQAKLEKLYLNIISEEKSQLEHLFQSIHPSMLLCLYDCNSEKKQIFVGNKVTAGRDRGNDLFLTTDPYVSRKHAVFLSRDDEKIDWIIQDCGSKNGTFLNDVRLVADVPHPIHQGDRINFAGESLFIVCDKSIEAAEKTEIIYTCECKEKKPAVDYNSSRIKQFVDDLESGHLPPVSKPSQTDIEECMEERKKLREKIECKQMKPVYIEKLESNLKIPVEIEIWVNKVVDYYFSDLKYGPGLRYGIWAAEAKLYELKGYHWYDPSELHPAWLID